MTLPAYGKPAPSLPAAGPAHPLPSHQVFGFLPYWSLGDPTQVPYSDLTTVAYFSLDVAKDGSVVEQGQAYDDLSGYDFSSLMQGAHAAGVRVLLTISDATSSTLSAICSRPGVSAANMTAGIEHLIETYGFDGVDIDLEGRATADRERFAELVGLVADKLHAVDASWDVAVDTYPQSAGDPTDFFDVAKIAPHVDQVFVMDYDAENMQVPSPTAPLNASGLSDVATLQAYSSVVPPGKLILGVPFYGVDWTVGKSGQPGSADGPVALTYDQITGAGATPLFDPATDTVFIHYDANGKHHFAWFDDPLTLTLKAALASVYHVAGVGIWALGMQGPNPSLVSALLGGSSPVRLPLAHQPS
ncbi:MAG TPA: glycosyl hydrolase family 18 protein [Acidimicrobiales bacterium]|nr:glycosyl hydrolase family 18 protein [Acidimicrobiales bacterium]